MVVFPLPDFPKKEYIRVLLVNKANSYAYIARHLFEGVDLEYILFKEKKYQKSKKKRLTLAWTIEDLTSFNLAKEYADSLTFQYLDLSLFDNKL